MANGVEETSPNGALLTAACVCKKFRDLAVRELYKDIAVVGQTWLLFPLLYRLLKDEKLAASVRSISVCPPEVASPLYEEAYVGWTLPQDFRDVLVRKFPAPESVEPVTIGRGDQYRVYKDDFENLIILHSLGDAMTCAIAKCCENIRYLGVPRSFQSYEEDFSSCTLFRESSIDWPYLKSIRLKASFGWDDEFQPPVLEQVSRWLSTHKTHPLRCLRCDRLIIADSILEVPPDFIYLPALILYGLGDTVRGTWERVSSFLMRCTDMEVLRIKFDMITIMNAFNETRKLYNALTHLEKTLRVIEIDNFSVDYFEYNENKLQHPGDPKPIPLDWSVFGSLTDLTVPMPFIFGELFYVNGVGIDRRFSIKPVRMSQSFADSLRYFFVDNLPPSLRHLKLLVLGIEQHQAVASALGGLLERRKKSFPVLRQIEILSREPYHSEEYLDVQDSAEFREAKKEGLSIEVASGYSDANGEMQYYQQLDLF